MLDNKVFSMTPGDVLLDAPIADYIEKMSKAIAEAQLRLDQTAVRVASVLAEETAEFTKETGEKVTKTLLELGFLPTFYHFTEATIEVSLAINFKVEESLDVKASANVGSTGDGGGTAGKGENNRAVPYGVSVSLEYKRKYDYSVTGNSKVETKLVSVPPPAVFIDMLKEHARASGGAIG